MAIHPQTVIHSKAQIADDVTIGPYSIIGSDVEIEAGTWIGPHVVINGPTHIGKENRIYQFASIGEIPQDKKYHNEEARLEIGDRNTIREYVSINRGTQQGGGVTRVGNDNWLMAYIHIAHDCKIGCHTIFANGATLAGHVVVEDYAILGGFTLVHQFCAIGTHAFCGMGSAIAKDVPPYIVVSGNPAHPHTINSEGLKRLGLSSKSLQVLREAYKILYRSGMSLDAAKSKLRDMAKNSDEVAKLLEFIQSSQRSIIR